MREKTSQARILSARFNPINEQDKEVLNLLDQSGKPFKKFVSDTALSMAGYTPHDFANERAKNGTMAILDRLETMSIQMDSLMAQMTQDLIDKLQESGKFIKTRHDDDDDKDDSGISNFARNFGRSFLERQNEDE